MRIVQKSLLLVTLEYLFNLPFSFLAFLFSSLFVNLSKSFVYLSQHLWSGTQPVLACISLSVSSCCSRFGQSNSLPTAGCVGGSVPVRRSLRQFQMPSRSLPGARLGLLGSGGLLGPTPRSSSSTPTGPKQGRQVSQTSRAIKPERH